MRASTVCSHQVRSNVKTTITTITTTTATETTTTFLSSFIVFFLRLAYTWNSQCCFLSSIARYQDQVRKMCSYVPLVLMLQANLIREYRFLVLFCALLPTWYQVPKILYLIVPSKHNDIDRFIFIRSTWIFIHTWSQYQVRRRKHRWCPGNL